MKFKTPFLAGLAGFGLLLAATAEDAVKFNVPGVSPSAPAGNAPAQPATPAAPTAAPAAKVYTEAQVAEAYGWFMGAQMGLRQLEFTKEQVDAMARGMAGIASGGQPPFDAKEIGPQVEAFLAKKNQSFMGKVRVQQVAANNEFFSKLKENKNVVETPSGLRYEVVKAGSGAVAKPGQLISINYTGSLVSGQVFDSNAERGEPAELLLQTPSAQNPNGIIPGMFEGLQKTGVGGKLKLYIPPSLAYGDEAMQGLPPSAALIFDVEILGVKDAPPAPPATPAAK